MYHLSIATLVKKLYVIMKIINIFGNQTYMIVLQNLYHDNQCTIVLMIIPKNV